jgi:phosphinothricin acetyltransferase
MRLSPFLRASTDEDVAAITEIYAHHVRTGLASFELVPPDAEEMARRRQDVVKRGLPYLVAEIEGRVVGYAYAGPYRPRPAYRFTVEDSIYIHPEHTRKGIGRLLLAAVIARCEDQGYRQMVAVIGDSGNASSIGLHLAFGFEHAGALRNVGFKFGRWVDTVLMQRALGPGGAKLPEGT